MKIKNILVGFFVGLLVSLFFGLWLVWFIGNNKLVNQCMENLNECRANYCAACLTDTECEKYCN